jgi:hypothetical protein
MDHTRFQALVKELYSTVNRLEKMFPGRHFTPDGHMVGSIGECLVADAYGLELMTASNKGFDALSPCGKQVEIKATQSKSAAFRSEPEHVIVIQIAPDGSFTEIFNGPGSVVWKQFDGKPLPSNGQYQISINRLKKLNKAIASDQKVHRVA